VLLQEEVHWCFGSRHVWIESGDKNRRFYHLYVQNRKRKNAIHWLALPNGEELGEQAKL
jgi:hypothetical protein